MQVGFTKNRMVMVVVIFMGLNGICWGRYSGGTGIPDDPYRIGTVSDWKDLTESPGDWDKQFVLISNIDFGGADITPVAPGVDPLSSGSPVVKFAGTLDGQGYVICHFVIDRINHDAIGLFGVIGHDGQVINLGLEGGIVAGRSCTGGLCGKNSGLIRQCYVKGELAGRGSGVGGLCGKNTGSISQCYARGGVTSDGFEVGGLCGFNAGTISQCYSTVSVTGKGSSVGGLCGRTCSLVQVVTMKDSFWDTQASGQTRSAGGIGLGTDQLQSMACYSANGWAGKSWTLPLNSYPCLAWELAGGQKITEPVITMSGSGTKADPWQIARLDDLVQITPGSFFGDKHFQLNKKLDLSQVCWTRVGYGEYRSSGRGKDKHCHTDANLILFFQENQENGILGYMGAYGQIKRLGAVTVSILENTEMGDPDGKKRGNAHQSCVIERMAGNGYAGGLHKDKSRIKSQCYPITEMKNNIPVKGMYGENQHIIRVRTGRRTGTEKSSGGGDWVIYPEENGFVNCRDVVIDKWSIGPDGMGLVMTERHDKAVFNGKGWNFSEDWQISSRTIKVAQPVLQKNCPVDAASKYKMNQAKGSAFAVSHVYLSNSVF